MSTVIEMINNILGLGRVGYYGFSSNMLRKFHTSSFTIKAWVWTNSTICMKRQKQTNVAYFMTDDLKYEYIQHMPAVTINTDVEKLSIKHPIHQIEKENEALKSK